METALETIKQGPFTLEIFQDSYASNPMEDMDFLGTRLDTRHNLESLSGRDLIAEIGNSIYSQVPTQDRGYVYLICIKADWKKEFPTKAQAQKCLDGEAEILQSYFDGEIYGYTLSIGETVLDSLWGMYGFDYCLSEGKDALAIAQKTELEAVHFQAESFAL